MYPICILDGSVNDKITVTLCINEQCEVSRVSTFRSREKTSCVQTLAELCAEHSVHLADVKTCIVVEGSKNRFTISRMLQVTANALALAHGVALYNVAALTEISDLAVFMRAHKALSHVQAEYALQPTMH